MRSGALWCAHVRYRAGGYVRLRRLRTPPRTLMGRVGSGPVRAGQPGHRGPIHSEAMDTQTITQSLAYISWVLLLAIGLGSLALVVLLRQATDATRGFLGFTAICAALAGLLVFFIDGNLPDPAQLHHIHAATPDIDTARRTALGAFTLLGFAAGVRLLGGHRDGRRRCRWQRQQHTGQRANGRIERQ